MFTGHSLGAAQAEYNAVLYSKQAITFESPGITRLLERSIIKSGRNSSVDVKEITEAYSSLITSYLSRPNMINIAREKVGSLIRIYPSLRTKTPYSRKGAAIVFSVLQYLKVCRS